MGEFRDAIRQGIKDGRAKGKGLPVEKPARHVEQPDPVANAVRDLKRANRLLTISWWLELFPLILGAVVFVVLVVVLLVLL